MNADRQAGIWVGVFFIAAAVTSIVALILYQPILTDPNYIITGPAKESQILLGALLELILAATAIGTAITMFPFLRKQNETMALAHLCFRFMEAVLIVIGILSVLSLLTLTKLYASGADLNPDSLLGSAALLRAVHDWTFMLGPNFMLGINTFMYGYLFYRSKLVARPVAVLGIVGGISVFAAAILELFGVIDQLSAWGAVLSLPVGINEMTLAVYLIVKGFNTSVVDARPVISGQAVGANA